MRALFLVAALALTGCFSPTEPICSFACSDTAPLCPLDYTCLSDGYCHLHGDPTACGFSDASVPQDMAVPTGDISVGSDLASSDLASHD